jgi:hypothetical protein
LAPNWFWSPTSRGQFWICPIAKWTNSHLGKPLHSNPGAVSCDCKTFIQSFVLVKRVRIEWKNGAICVKKPQIMTGNFHSRCYWILGISDKFREIRLWDLLPNNHKLILTVSFRVTVSCFKLNAEPLAPRAGVAAAIAAWGGREIFARVRARHWLVSRYRHHRCNCVAGRIQWRTGHYTTSKTVSLQYPLKLKQMFRKILY